MKVQIQFDKSFHLNEIKYDTKHNMAANIAAATSRERARRSENEGALLKSTRQAFLRKVKRERKRASEKFDLMAVEWDEHGLYILESRVEEFLVVAFAIPKESLDPDAVQLVIDSTAKNQEKNGCVVKEGHLSKYSLMESFQKYHLYVRSYEKIEKIFKKFDQESDGYLSRTELCQALREREREHDRRVSGGRVILVVKEKDLDFIIEQADADKTGKINRAEFLPAIAVWEELAEIRITEMENSMKCSCTIQ